MGQSTSKTKRSSNKNEARRQRPRFRKLKMRACLPCISRRRMSDEGEMPYLHVEEDTGLRNNRIDGPSSHRCGEAPNLLQEDESNNLLSEPIRRSLQGSHASPSIAFASSLPSASTHENCTGSGSSPSSSSSSLPSTSPLNECIDSQLNPPTPSLQNFSSHGPQSEDTEQTSSRTSPPPPSHPSGPVEEEEANLQSNGNTTTCNHFNVGNVGGDAHLNSGDHYNYQNKYITINNSNSARHEDQETNDDGPEFDLQRLQMVSRLSRDENTSDLNEASKQENLAAGVYRDPQEVFDNNELEEETYVKQTYCNLPRADNDNTDTNCSPICCSTQKLLNKTKKSSTCTSKDSDFQSKLGNSVQQSLPPYYVKTNKRNSSSSKPADLSHPLLCETSDKSEDDDFLQNCSDSEDNISSSSGKKRQKSKMETLSRLTNPKPRFQSNTVSRICSEKSILPYVVTWLRCYPSSKKFKTEEIPMVELSDNTNNKRFVDQETAI